MSSQRKPSKGGKGGHKTEGPGKYVEPGDDTGCYYLLISNVSPNTVSSIQYHASVLTNPTAAKGHHLEGYKRLP